MQNLTRMGIAGALMVPASAAPDCQPSTTVKYAPHPGAIVVQTSFENGDLDQFIPTTSGKGVVAVSTAQHRSGACSAYLPCGRRRRFGCQHVNAVAAAPSQ
jgi:hypothetical protein